MNNILEIINNLPLTYPEILLLRQKYMHTGSVQDLIDLINNKLVPQFTKNQIESLNILKKYVQIITDIYRT